MAKLPDNPGREKLRTQYKIKHHNRETGAINSDTISQTRKRALDVAEERRIQKELEELDEY